MNRRAYSPAETGQLLGCHRKTVIDHIARGSFGAEGVGWFDANPDGQPRYRITERGIQHYITRTGRRRLSAARKVA